MTQFSALAEKYDLYNSADFDAWAAFARAAFARASIPVHEVLDLACGTGELTLRLSHVGYDMTGIDLSEEMLDVFRAKLHGEDILLACQDMRKLDLYGTVQAAVCSFDSLNYLRTAEDLRRTFAGVRLFTEKGGVFAFDVNTKYAYTCVYGDNAYVYEDGEDMLVWQNCFTPSGGLCRFYLTRFDRLPSGSFRRSDEVQTEKYFPPRTLARLLAETGWEVLDCFGTPEGEKPTATSVKHYYVCRAI